MSAEHDNLVAVVVDHCTCVLQWLCVTLYSMDAVAVLLYIGYDAMGYELAKPRLRAELENDLKLLVFSSSCHYETFTHT